MKKFVALFLTVVMTVSMASVAFAAPRSTNANYGPGVSQVDRGEVSVRIGGNGNSARLIAYVDGVQAYLSANRPANNAVTTLRFDGFVVAVTVRGNSIINVNVVERPTIVVAPYIVSTTRVREFVEYNQIDSFFTGTSEVAGSRAFVNGSAVLYGWERRNNFPGVNGQGVRTGATVTGTLNFQFVRNYVEQFERIYQWVNVTVWSDGRVYREIEPNSTHVNGEVSGDAYYNGPFNGSRDVSVSGGQIILHMGFQGGLHDRTADVTVGAFTINFELLNTGNSPSNTVVRITNVDLAAL